MTKTHAAGWCRFQKALCKLAAERKLYPHLLHNQKEIGSLAFDTVEHLIASLNPSDDLLRHAYLYDAKGKQLNTIRFIESTLSDGSKVVDLQIS